MYFIIIIIGPIFHVIYSVNTFRIVIIYSVI